jgi:hypothetical protein
MPTGSYRSGLMEVSERFIMSLRDTRNVGYSIPNLEIIRLFSRNRQKTSTVMRNPNKAFQHDFRTTVYS